MGLVATLGVRSRGQRQGSLTSISPSGYPDEVRIIDDARKHGVVDEDILHAARLPLRDWDLDDDAIMRICPARDGQLLEIGIAGVETEEPVIFHAMECRDRFNPHL
jgi:hypothetical protein